MNGLPLRPTIPAEALLSWSSQVRQYPSRGVSGLGYFKGELDEDDTRWVDCLLWRDQFGKVVGILNHYPFDFPPFEKAGNVNIWIEPTHQRQGIATSLWCEARRRWPTIRLERQRFTAAGSAFAWSLRERGLE